jgi:hypothetical protein
VALPTESFVQYCEEIAESLEPQDWRTGAILELESILTHLRGPGIHAALDHATRLQSHFANLLLTYSNTTLEMDEVTAESIAGHILLVRGLQEWIDVLDRVLAFQPQPGDEGFFEEASRAAEHATRQLVAVQLFEQEVTESAGGRGERYSTQTLLTQWSEAFDDE